MPLSMPTTKALWDYGELLDADGHVDRPVLAEHYLAPAEIWIEGDLVRWGSGLDFEKPRDSTQGILEDLLSLRPGSTEMVLEFARRWGPIKMTYHYECLDGSRRRQDEADNEPVASYFELAEYVRDILKLASEVYSGHLTEQQWLERFPFHCENCMCGLEDAMHLIERQVGVLLKASDISLELKWIARAWTIQIWIPDALGGIATQLMLAITRADGLYTCSSCGYPYLRSAVERAQSGRIEQRRRRRPRPGESNYCIRCGTAAARQKAKRNYRGRMAEARRRFAAGETAEQIAESIGSALGSVQEWIREGKRNAEKTR